MLYLLADFDSINITIIIIDHLTHTSYIHLQDKYLQKMHFKQHGVALPEFMKIDSLSAAVEAGKIFGYPLMLKSRRLAYDGRGNAVAKSEEVLPVAIAALGGIERGLYVEKWAPFVKELAVIVARGRNACICSFPVVETTHKDSICHTVVSPAQVAPDIAAAAMQVAERAVGSLSGAGIFGVELFLLEDGKVLLNEVAPRPHNSGHHTIEACYVSQYEQHLRCILGLPLGDPAMRVPAAMMYNLLGEAEGEEGFAIVHETMMRAMSVPGASVHWYEKPEIRKQRKMGHITVVGPSMEVVRTRMDWIVNGKDLSQFKDEPLQTPPRSSLLPVFAVSPTTDGGSSAASGPPVSIIMGSDSDLPVMKSAAEILQSFNIPYELTVVSAHRTPERMVQFAQNAHKRGVKVIIAGAGGAAHLPGMVASMTPLPVIGVPVKGTSTDGLDSLLSIAQMPRGIPVATVAIQNATNAGLTAVRMLGVESPELDKKMTEYQNGLKEMVLEKAERLERVGWQEYLNKKYESEPLQTPPHHGSTSSLPMFADSPTTDSSSTVSAPPIGIIMGSDSDLPVMMRAAEILQLFNVPYELTVVSAHRTPERMVQYAQDARKRGVKVIIAGAGGAAHLPGMVASMTSRPVIGVPVKGSSTDGLDSLLSIVQMPRGIPVATVAIQNATNAGLLAVRVLGVENPELVKKMIEYQNGLKEMVLETAERLERVGWQEYLNTK